MMDVNLQEKFVHHMEVAKSVSYDVQSEALQNSIRALLTIIQISRKRGFKLAEPPADFLTLTEGLIRNAKFPMDLAIVTGKINCLTKVFIQNNPTTIENLLIQSSQISERVPKICFLFGIMDCLPCDRCDVTVVTIAEEISQLLLNFNSVYFYQMKLFHTWLQYVQNIVCFIPNSNPIRTQLLLPQSVMVELTILHLETTQVQNVSEQCLATICDIWRSLQLSPQYAKTVAKTTLTNLTWQSKSKYLILATLLPFINLSEILDEYPDTIHAMTYSLDSNVKCLLAAGTTLFKALAKSLTSEEWAECCQSVLLDALNHSNPNTQRNAAHYWLPCMVHASPPILVELKRCLLKANRLNWLAYISLLKLIDYPDDGDRLLAHQALNYGEEEVRIAAFAILLHANKKTEAARSEDWDLFSNFLLNNLRSDNPQFRLQLLSTTRLFLIRVLESSLNKIKSNYPIDEEIDNLRKLHDRLLKCLTKSSSYQKKITSLSVLHYILQLFGESDAQADSLAKGASLTRRRQLIQLAGDRWDFTGKVPLDHYTICLMDEVPDIHKKAAEILRNFFPCPPLSYLQLLYRQGLEMCDSVQFQRSKCGALAIQMISHWSFSNIAAIPELTIEFLMEEIKKRFHQLKLDWLTGASLEPVHGFVGALINVLQLPHHQHSAKSYADLIELSEMISYYMLDVLARKSNGNQVMAPSFEEMSQSMDEIVLQCNPTKMSGTISISVQHQLILTCIWLNLKESGNLAAQVATLLLNDEFIAKEQRTDKIEQCAEILYRILLRCRHKGAIEAAGDAMGLLCRKMFANREEVIRAIPGRILTNFLERLGNLKSGASITRRSAGLAYLVSKIVSSQPEKLSWDSLLVMATERLISVAQRPVDLNEDQDDACDLPQSVAIHILKSLVHDASLSVGLQPALMGPIFKLSVNSFSHPHWSVRNAALQLHGAVMPRLIGTSSKTTADLFHKLPGLETFLIDKLGEETDDQKLVSRGLIPSLSILSRLSPGHRNEYRNCRFTFSLMAVLGHPVHQVRQLAARSLLAFIPLLKTKCITLQLCADAVILANENVSEKPLHMCVRGSSSTNSLHGCLLAVFECVSRCLDIALSLEDWKLIRKAVSELTLIENDHPSFYIKLAILKIFQMLPGIMTQESEFLRVYRDESVRQAHACQPGFNEWLRLKTELLFSEVSINSIWEIHAMAIQDYLAFYSGMDVLGTILKVITNRFARFSSTSVMANHVNSYMMYYIAHWQTYPSLLPVCLDFVQARGAMALQETETSLQEHIHFFLDQCIEKRQLGSAVALLAIPTASVVIKETLAKNLMIDGIDEVVARLSRCLLDASQPEESLSFRDAAVSSLKTMGRTLMEKPNKSCETSRNLFLLILNLIQDEDKNIRANAALFLTDLVSSFNNTSREHSNLVQMSPTRCLEEFARHISRWFSKQNLIPIIFNMLKDPDRVEDEEIQFLYNREPRNFFHDESDLVHFLIKVVNSLLAPNDNDSKRFLFDIDMQEIITEAGQCLDRIRSDLSFNEDAKKWLFTQSARSYSVLTRLCARLTIIILCCPNWKTDQRFLELKIKRDQEVFHQLQIGHIYTFRNLSNRLYALLAAGSAMVDHYSFLVIDVFQSILGLQHPDTCFLTLPTLPFKLVEPIDSCFLSNFSFSLILPLVIDLIAISAENGRNPIWQCASSDWTSQAKLNPVKAHEARQRHHSSAT